ncbi:MAG: isoleucine--tRNA ligase [Paludibacteraceae bacterium]|jgi:isoleucyl-tRNA synthetase|nr:isoleucine--tRNA ligase [Paludibacteraceae bacterium]MBP9040061.1 isoleucine--tRNA ligase [Paludibacteraceae bacterium]HHT60836.1 isoleucine--tRNA ligase [Bacteroidales bacterium]HOA47179.1 isoleucine--tRNA ligase [Paludibacteraceae bacterium]HPW96576.1 isoleucine--tRNA ligase [Paludibacteraceae bacterium]
MKKFKEYSNFDLSEINKKMLKQWSDEDLFHQSIAIREGSPSFVFFEGPPSANGMPGIHHVMARTIKDTFCRYKTMQGFQVKRKAGWDTHGLPVELGVEKMLGITKEDIGKKISVDDYNAACRREVMKYTKEWEDLTTKMGYWVDMENPYITYDNKYIETLWYLLKQLYNKGLLYKGYTIQPYSPAAGTGLSSHELNQPGCYRDVKDTTCTAQFKIKGDRFGSNAYFLAWTTTPWTLPSNTALCVGEKIIYNIVKSENPYTGIAATYIIAKDLVSDYFGDKKVSNFEIVGECKGTDLLGIEYEQLFPWVAPCELVNGKIVNRKADAFRVISGDYVTTENGTGIVHIAPTFGADDAFVAKKSGIPALFMINNKNETRPMVDFTGKYWKLEELNPEFVKECVNVELYKQYAGQWVKNAYDPQFSIDGRYDEEAALKAENLDIRLCMAMKAEGTVFKIEKHTHNYPHCWRTDKPVLYYPLDSWFIKTTACREEMIELNKTINWKPESTGTGRFGKWLENLNDWNLSRSRYWGTPLPIWRTEDGKEEICIGSIEELFAEIDKAIVAGVMKENPYKNFKVGDYSKENYDPKNIDLHRPYVDDIVLVSASGKPMKRELDLIDVWFDSGAMPYAQVHYPFEDPQPPKEGIKTADFISEGVDQTRGWFFTLHAIHTMIDNQVAFKNVISSGLVLDKNGNKMSKRLGNAVDPFETIEKYGSDPLRWYMMTNASPWDNLKFDPEGIEEVRRKFFGTLYNTYSFFALYANVDGFEGTENEVPVSERPEIDRWILSLLNTLIKEVTEHYDNYEPTRAGRAVQDFVGENLSNWYVRLNRKRFWGGTMDADKLSAYQTLYTCLITVSKLMAPIAPFYADKLFRNLTDQHRSVHLEKWAKYDEKLIDSHLEECMRLAQQATSMILALRKKANKKVRQPLQKAVIPAPDATTLENLKYVTDLIKTEVNVKEIQVVTTEDSTIKLVKGIKPNFKTLGKKYGKQMKEIAAAVNAFTQAQIGEVEKNGQIILPLPSGEVVVELTDVEIATEDMPGWLVANEGVLTIALDIEVNEELRQEGIARELVNRIQNIRKSIGLEITDKICVQVEKQDDINAAVETHNEYISSQVLATSLTLADNLANPTELDFEDFIVKVSVEKA